MEQTASTDQVDADESVHRDYVLDVRIVETNTDDGPTYRFEAPDHVGITFDDPDDAALYADVYFAVNGFVEADTGDRGVPPEVVMAGKDALAAYMSIQTSVGWVASFYGAEPRRIERYIEAVREKAEAIRDGADEHGA